MNFETIKSFFHPYHKGYDQPSKNYIPVYASLEEAEQAKERIMNAIKDLRRLKTERGLAEYNYILGRTSDEIRWYKDK